MIISASRRTDIPAFYGTWFYNRLAEGFVCVRNPMNPRQVSRIELSPENIDCLVFWTKNPEPFMHDLDRLNAYPYYFLFSLTPYFSSLEPGLPSKDQLMETFARLSDRIGKHRVVWRYDPILFSDAIQVDYHVRKFREMAGFLSPYTERCVISFLDMYRKCERNLKNTTVRRPHDSEMEQLLREMKAISQDFGIALETCAEKKDWSNLGIQLSRCIDNRLIERITGKPFSAKIDKNQRAACGCVESIDIGEYNTCLHFCRYCYANTNADEVKKKSQMHDPKSSVMIGELSSLDQVKPRKISKFNGPGFFS